MVMIGISITKETTFRDATQEFSNVYHFHSSGSLPTNAEATALGNELTGNEKTLHAANISFRRCRVWSAGGTKAENNMIADFNLSGTGVRTNDNELDKERAYLFRWRVGNNSRGKPNYLRKWYHTGGPIVSSQTLSANHRNNTSGFTQPERDSQALAVSAVTGLGTPTETWKICAPSDQQEPDGTQPEAHKYLEHHQLGDQWRG